MDKLNQLLFKGGICMRKFRTKRIIILGATFTLSFCQLVFGYLGTEVRATARETNFTYQTSDQKVIIPSNTEIYIISIEEDKVLAKLGGQIGYIPRIDLKFATRYAVGWVPLYSSPDIESEEIDIIPMNEKVTIMKDIGNGYMEVTYDGKIGYCDEIYLSSLEVIELTESEIEKVKNEGKKIDEREVIGKDGKVYHQAIYELE